jgi:nucleotide-binding universal stress UspA family protein
MAEKTSTNKTSEKKEYKVLVAIDFSPCSAHALKSSTLIMGRKPDRIFALHVIDHDFIERCITSRLGTESQIKKTLFVDAKEKLKQFLQDQNMATNSIETEVCEGTPFIAINSKAIEKDVDIVIMGTHGTSGDIKNIFFGSTTERVLRFIKRPVLCVPIEEDRKE